MSEEPETAIEKIEAEAGDILAKVHAEVDAMWLAIFTNVSNRVETPIHNFLHNEKEALKARLSALFHKEN